MYGVNERVCKESGELIIKVLANNYEEFVRYADKKITDYSNGASPLGADLVADLYASLRVNMEDRDDVATELDARRVIMSWIGKVAHNVDKYTYGCVKVGANKCESIYDEEGKVRDFAAPEEYNMFDYTEAEVEEAVEFMCDTFEEGAERVDTTIKALVNIAKQMQVIENSNYDVDVKNEKISSILKGVKCMGFNGASEEFKDSFRTLFAKAMCEANA